MRDFDFHMKHAIRSLEQAESCAKTGRGRHTAQEAAGVARKFARRVKHFTSTMKGE